ncbi:MAG: sugar transferase [Campylobacterota bacterium]|nr:sugar transferase [Campylobacterota bacterium]
MRKLLSFLLLLITDGVSLWITLYLAYTFRIYLQKSDMFSEFTVGLEHFYLSGLLFVLFAVINFSLGLYTKRNDFWEELRRSYISAFLLLISIVMILFITKSTEEFSRTFYILMFLNLLWTMPLTRITCKKVLHQLGLWHINAFLVGNEEQVEKLKKDLSINWYLGYKSVESIKKAKIVFIATKEMKVELLEKLIHKYKRRVKEVILIPYLHNISFANSEIIDLRIGRMSFINIQNQLFITKNIYIKKVAEFLLILLMLPVVSAAMLLIAIGIKLNSKGAVFFRQKRLGEDGKVFMCYKFRTMHEESDALLSEYLNNNPDEVNNYNKYHKYKKDPRITSVGRLLRKSSLDELPQIINVFKGEMNLIGPRPYMINEEEKIGENVETILHVKPGLTGLWQISGRNNLDFFERVELDVWYIQNWSLWLDFIIFIKTFLVLATRRGAQ